jgi:hypothetical protein
LSVLLQAELSAFIKVDLDVIAKQVLEVKLLHGVGGLIGRRVSDCGLALADLLSGLVKALHELALLYDSVFSANCFKFILAHLQK